MNLLQLAERVEGLTGPDREVDVAIFHLLDIRGRNLTDDERDIVATEKRRGHLFLRHVKPYTASLDAAMTLVPEGCGFNLDRYWIKSDDDGQRWSCHLTYGGVPGNPRRATEAWDARTAALAITAAALNARATSETSSVEGR